MRFVITRLFRRIPEKRATELFRSGCDGVVALTLLWAISFVAGCEQPVRHSRPHGQPSPPDPSPPALIAASTQLKATLIVPTLDTPFPQGKSAVWCSSFQLAWNSFKRTFTQGPVQLQHAEEVAGRLNNAPQSESDLEPADYLVAAGRVKDVRSTIDREMPVRFPGRPAPQIDAPADALIAFAMLKAGVRYTYDFKDNPEALIFTDSAGKKSKVRSFGLLPLSSTGADDSDAAFARRLVSLLYVSRDEHHPAEFAVDLCRESTPYQVVAACLKRKDTLQATLADLEEKIQRSPVPPNDHLDEDHLLVPNMFWRMEHHFRELEGPEKIIQNGSVAGLYMAVAYEEIEFKLDRHGAEVFSSAYAIPADGGPKELVFNRPFLIYLKKRDADQPFFVMWVDNAELMRTFDGPPR